MYLLPKPEDAPQLSLDPVTRNTSLQYFSAYDLPSVEAIVCYLHAAEGFHVRNTWLQAITSGNFESWPGLTYRNEAKSWPITDETLKGNMAQVRQRVQSTNTKPQNNPTPQNNLSKAISIPRNTPSNEIHIQVEHTRKPYTDDTGCFPVRSRSGNKYIMVAYHCD